MIYTFYSYKGGVGRSMALANVGKWLSLQGLRVVMVDWDLEAPGLEDFFYDAESDLDRVRSHLGVIDLLLDFRRQYPHLVAASGPGDVAGLVDMFEDELPPLASFLVPLDSAENAPSDTRGGLWLLPAGWRSGAQFSAYAQAVQTFDWGDLYARFAGEAYFEWMRRQLDSVSDVALIDSRTGVTEMGGVCTRQLADVVVLFCAPNHQNLSGVTAMAASFRREEILAARGRPLELITVPTRIDNSEIDERNRFEVSFKQSADRYRPIPFLTMDKSFWDLRLPYIPKYAYREMLVVGSTSAAEELEDAYKQLAVHMTMLAPEGSAPRRIWAAALGPGRSSEASAAPAIWNVPYQRNPNFLGREDVFSALHTILSDGRPAVICGLGGLGKTQLVAEFAYRNAADYDLVWWVRAEDEETLVEDYAGLGALVGLTATRGSERSEMVTTVHRWLEQHQRWLLVFDQVSDARVITGYLPQNRGGHVLITSRSPVWRETARAVELTVLGADDAVQVLLRRSGQTDEESGRELAKALGYLPLALDMAGGYMEATGSSIADYLAAFRQYGSRVLSSIGSDEKGFDIRSVFALSLDQVNGTMGGEILNLCAFFAPDDIPFELLSGGPVPMDLGLNLVNDEFALYQGIALLRRHSLVIVGERVLSIHPLLQSVVRSRLTPESNRLWARAAVGTVRMAFPENSDDVGTWDRCGRLLPHLLAAAAYAETAGVEGAATRWLLDRAATYLRGRAQFPRARALFERVLAIDEGAYGPGHPAVGSDLNNLASVLRDLGDFNGARQLLERALAIDEAFYGPEHPAVSSDLNNLASALRDLGEYNGARELFQRALAIDEAFYSPEHPAVGSDLNNLASALRDLGDYGGARKHFERALAIDEAVYGPDHPAVSSRLNNLGLALKDLGDYDGARKLFERALAIDEAVYGPDHPAVSSRLNNLGLALEDLGDLDGARKLFERALAIDEAVYGPDHPETLFMRRKLARWLGNAGRVAEAIERFTALLADSVRVLGPDHPDTLTIRANLAHWLGEGGREVEAVEQFEALLADMLRVLGPDHPDTLSARSSLAALTRGTDA